MRATIPNEHPLHRWFAGMVQDVLYAEIGMCDPALADYLAGLLTEFIHRDRIFALQDGRGRPLEQVAEMLANEAHQATASREDHERLVHRHIGDFTLFWMGVFPENLRRLRASHRRDHLIDYARQGKRSYAIASDLSGERTEPPAALLRRLSDHFEFCVFGLGRVREQVRTVEAEARLGGSGLVR